MALDAKTIKAKLDSAGWMDKDDVAVQIVNGASKTELAALDREAVLRLYDVIKGGVITEQDTKALQTLAADTQFTLVTTPDYGVDLVKAALASDAIVQSELTPDIIKRIYAAEKKRLSFGEGYSDMLPGSTMGRGQLGQPAYDDVKRDFATALRTCIDRVYLSQMLARRKTFGYDRTTYEFPIPVNYSSAWGEEAVEDFVVAVYLATRIQRAGKTAGRSIRETMQFAVALYHGMYKSLVNAQGITKDTIHWAPLIPHLKKDDVYYVNEVVI